MTTPHHAKYFAYELTRQGGAGVERLSRLLFDASVDLNPHQVKAALFAMRSPLSSGALLADEAGCLRGFLNTKARREWNTKTRRNTKLAKREGLEGTPRPGRAACAS